MDSQSKHFKTSLIQGNKIVIQDALAFDPHPDRRLLQLLYTMDKLGIVLKATPQISGLQIHWVFLL
jgi:hypothetical protein